MIGCARATLSGHASGHLRDRFLELIERGLPDNETEQEELFDLCGKLWRCRAVAISVSPRASTSSR
jgi:hypothetical protein